VPALTEEILNLFVNINFLKMDDQDKKNRIKIEEDIQDNSDEEIGDEEESEEHEGEIIEEHLSSNGSQRKRRRKKIKIRKRVKIKRKASPKKKAKKMIETISWVIIIAAFVTTLVIMMLHLDLNPKSKKTPKVSELKSTTNYKTQEIKFTIS
jgi:hypothetical protein